MDQRSTLTPCPKCGQAIPPETGVCLNCSGEDPAATLVSPPPSSGSETVVSGPSDPGATVVSGPPLRGKTPKIHYLSEEEPQAPAVGTVLAERYEVLATLGVGGMGSVYKVFDKVLSRVVALKTIHPQLAATPVMMKRFKQEVLLAQKITHKNVVRIFDIGEDNGTAFITMQFVEGVSLHDVIKERGKFSPADAVATIREVCLALESAHSEGVVHRDLKPQNIMIDKDGRVIVMDFGIARSTDSSGATHTGALLGTPDYMSPEQARMEEVDARSDIFSLGLIFFELLTGKLAFSGKTVVETMFIRTKERAIPPAEIDARIPAGANDIVVKCLEPDRTKRYQTVAEIVEDLDNFDPTRKAGAKAVVKSRLRRVSPYRNWIVAAAIVLLLVAGGFFLRNSFVIAPPAVHENVTVFIADFANHTDDPSLNNLLEPVIRLGLEDAGFITAFDRAQAIRGLDLDPIPDRIDETEAQKIAVSEGLGYVVSGSLDQDGSRYVISVKTANAVTGDVLNTRQETASNKDQILYAATKIAGSVRSALGDDTSEDAQRFAMEKLSATSLAAVREYATAMNALSKGEKEEALRNFSNAVDLDPNFGLAYAGMAVASRNLGKLQQAEQYIRLALEKIDRMTEREKYRTRAYYYSLSGDRQKCVEEYSALIKSFPSDVAAHNNLANCLTQTRDMPRAIQEVREAMAILPKRVLYRNNLSLFASYGSDFKTGEEEARRVQEAAPTYDTGFVALAFAQMGQGRPEDARQTYEKLAEFNPLTADAGLADIALYEGRYADAIRILEKSADEEFSMGSKDRAAMKFDQLAYARLMQGKKTQAAAAAEQAIAASQTPKIYLLSGLIFNATGQTAKAEEMAMHLAMESLPEPQSYSRILQADTRLQEDDAASAIPLLMDAIRLLDTWIARFELGKAYLKMGKFVEAQGELERCLERRGETLALFLDEIPTSSHFPQVYYYLGQALEGLNSPGAADRYREYLAVREKGEEDVLIADARKRAK